MKMIVSLLLMSILGCANANFDLADPEIKVAVMRTTAWLNLIDEEFYAKSWEETADVFQKNVTAEKWEELAGSVIKQVGHIEKRVIFYADYEKGKNQVGVKFNSKASIAGKVVESVYLSKEDGAWKVSGYWIK